MATTSAEPALAAGAKPLRMLRGVGSALAERLQAMGLSRQMDLWFHLPLRYEDRTRVTPVGELEPGAKAQVEGVVMAVERGFRFRPQLFVSHEGQHFQKRRLIVERSDFFPHDFDQFAEDDRPREACRFEAE